jgi:urease accessory protein
MEAIAFLELLAGTRLPQDAVVVPGVRAPDQCRARLLTVTTVDAATAVVARSVALDGGDLGPVTDAWEARTPDPSLREVSREHGADLLDTAGLAADPLPRPVAVGVIAAHGGVEAEDLARMVAFDDVQAVLVDEDEAESRARTAGLLPDIRELAAQLAHLDHPARIPATGAPLAAEPAGRR